MSAQQAPQTSLCKKRYGVSRKSGKPLRSDAHHGSGAGSTIVWDFIYILKFSSDVPVHLSPQEQPARAHHNTPSVQIFHHWLPSSPGTLRSEFSTLWAFTVIRLTASPPYLPHSVYPHWCAQLCSLSPVQGVLLLCPSVTREVSDLFWVPSPPQLPYYVTVLLLLPRCESHCHSDLRPRVWFQVRFKSHIKRQIV